MRRALAISLAAHALLLWPGAPRQIPERAAGALVATLRPAAVMPPAPGRAAAPPGTMKRAAAAMPPPAPAPAAVAPAPRSAMPSAAASVAPAGRGAERSQPLAAMPAAAAGGGAAGNGGEGVDGEGLRQYRLELAREARRHKRYPERALLAGVGGTAEVRVEHEAGAGAAPATSLARSSGNDVLDAAALDMIRRAAPRARVPEALRGQSFAVSLPVVFDPEER